MISVKTDAEEKLIDVTITGMIKAADAMRVSTEIKQAMRKFGPDEALLLIDLVGFMPMSTDVVPMLRGIGRDVITFFHKAALVQEFAAKFQGRQVIEPPPGVKLPSYPTREEALKYLLEA